MMAAAFPDEEMLDVEGLHVSTKLVVSDDPLLRFSVLHRPVESAAGCRR